MRCRVQGEANWQSSTMSGLVEGCKTNWNPLCRVLGAAELASLRTELRSLRQQWQEARAPSRAGKGLESQLVRAVKEEAVGREEALQAELQCAKSALATQLAKAQRARRAHERDMRSQTAKANDLAAALEAAHQCHISEVAALRAATQAVQAAAAEELQRQQRIQDAELARLAAEAEATGAALEERHRTNAAQLSAHLGQQQQEMAAAHAALQRRCLQLEKCLGEASAAQHAAQADAAEERRLREDLEQHSAAAAQAAAQCQAGLQAALVAARCESQEELAEARRRKDAELEALQARFLALLATKDDTIAALRQQAAEAVAALGDLV